MIRKFLRHRNVLRTALAVLMVILALSVAMVPTLRPAALLARYWSGQLDSMPDDQVAAQLAQIAELGDVSSPVLVDAVGSDRAVLASAAANELHHQLDRWSAQPLAQSSPKVAHLAELLAMHVGQWDGQARSAAADLASRILRWPVSRESANQADVIAHCETILRSSTAAGSPPRSEAPRSEVARDNETLTALHTGPEDSSPQNVLSIPMTGEAGGGLPIEEVKIPPFPPSLAEPVEPTPITGNEPQLMPPVGKQLPYVMFPENEAPAEDPVPDMPASPVPRELDPDVQQNVETTELPPLARNRLDYELEHLPDLDLIRRLSDPRPWMVSAAEDQLESRGFQEKELNLARIIANPDVQKRRELARSLDRLTRSPGRWLLWLSQDPDPSVRRVVVSIMATSQDPRLQLRLRELMTSELDSEVREALRQWNDATTQRR